MFSFIFQMEREKGNAVKRKEEWKGFRKDYEGKEEKGRGKGQYVEDKMERKGEGVILYI